MSIEQGTLYVVATPIGNLGDFSPRAREVLEQVDRIAAEDTRRAGKLLKHFAIHTPVVSLHEHNELARVAPMVEGLEHGQALALISDAGTPLISDPGYRLVREALRRGVPVVAVPGPSALVAALSVSGLPTDRFIFEGFLPAKEAARRHRLETLRSEPRTLVFFEASHRITACIDDLVAILGSEREATLTRELTKRHETVHHAALAGVAQWLAADPDHRRGEFVVVVHGAPDEDGEVEPEARRILRILLTELPVKRAVSVAGELTGAPRNRLYEWALEERPG